MRICDVCRKEMNNGFCIYDSEYYCSDDCLHSVYSPEEYEEICAEGSGKYMSVFNHNYQKGRARNDLLRF